MSFGSLPSALRDRVLHSRWNPLASIVGVRTTEPLAALTFDDGPDQRYTPRLLDVLARHGVRATFFMIGEAAAAHPEIVEAVARGGHTVANHTHSHPSLPYLSARERREQVRRCSEALGPHETRFFRPPHGHQSPGSRLDVLRCGYPVVCWGSEADDWNLHDPGWMVERLSRRLAPGQIILLHDGLWDPASEAAADRDPTLEAVDRFLERYESAYRFLPLAELLEEAPPVCAPWFKEPSPPALGRAEG